MDQSKNLDIIRINQKLTAYLNGQTDQKKWVILSPFCTMSPPKLKGDIGFAEAYEKVIDQLRNIKTESQIIDSVVSFKGWERRVNIKDQKDFLRPVFELRDFVRDQFIKEEILGFYFHGSISTQDYIPYYSDFDTLVIVKKAVIQNNKWLTSFKRRLTKSKTFLYLLDPLQHHGHFVITEYDLEMYNQSLFPLELFKYTTELTDYGSILRFNVLPLQRERLLEIFSFWLNYFENPSQFGFTFSSSYIVKRFIQSIIFVLIIYAELQNADFYYKKFIFDVVKQDFNHSQWSLIERATRVRKTCPFRSRYPYNLRKFLGFVHPKLLHVLHRELDRSTAKQMVSIMGENILDDVRKLTKQMASNLKRS